MNPAPIDPQGTPPLQGHSPEEILEHIQWLKGIARALVQDDGAADDLVQEAFGVVSAYERPVEDLRAFLSGTIRKLASRQRRTQTRRTRREHQHATPEALPAADDLAERVDTLRVVLEELRSLPAAQQRAISLRYIEGLQPEEIALREGIQPSTVRASISRGLAGLREQLDRRFGKRDRWSFALAPFAGVPCAPPVLGPTPSSTPSPTQTALSTVGTSASLGALLMSSTVISVLVAFPLVALGGWWLFQEREAPGDASLHSSTMAQEPTGFESRPKDPAVDATGLRKRIPTPIPQIADSARDPLAEPSIDETPRGTLVDAITKEPIPHFHLSVHSPGKVNQDLISNATGWFESEVPIHESSVRIHRVDDPRNEFTAFEQVDLEFPFEETVPIHIGPTFRLEGNWPVDLDPTDLSATLRHPKFFEVHASVRRGIEPWIRFPFKPEMRDAAGPFQLIVNDKDGLWVAKAPLDHCIGIQSEPILLTFKSSGAIHFQAQANGIAEPVPAAVQLDARNSHYSKRVWLAASPDGISPAVGVAGHLESGVYDWRVAGSQESETVIVSAGETVQVDVSLDATLPTFDARILIQDPTAKLSVGSVRAVLIDPSDPENMNVAGAERVPGAPEGEWHVQFQDITEQEWTLIFIISSDAYRLEPAQFTLEPGVNPPIIQAHKSAPRVSIDLEVVDAKTKQPLPLAKVAYQTSDLSGTLAERDESGVFFGVQIPMTGASHFSANAPGYKMKRVLLDPTVDGTTLTIELVEGWASFVTVWDLSSMQRLSNAQVWIDGTFAGETNERGEFWFEQSEKPKSIAIDTKVYKVTRQLELDEQGRPLESPFGYTIGVLPR